MSNFTTDSPHPAVIDLHKRVRHFTGLVMGEQEFRQEQAYFMARDELHQRALHGYGVVSGLGVSWRGNPLQGYPEIVVDAGLAVNPRGESICVPVDQCANLNAWLESERDQLLDSPPPLLPDRLTVYVVLCARDCETDPVAVLGDPCRTLEDATAPSRIADDFELCLRLEPPQQLEEEAVRRLGELLRAIEVVDAGTTLSPDEVADLVRQLLPHGSPPELGEIDLGSPALLLHREDLGEALDAIYRIWIQEVRPHLNPETGACEVPRDLDGGRCLLLACLHFDYDDSPAGLVLVGDVTVDATQGPILAQTRVLQELLSSQFVGEMFADGGGSPPVLPVPFSEIHADLQGLTADDHPQYLLVDDLTRALVVPLNADGNLITGLGETVPPGPDHAVRADRAVKVDDQAGGDLDGTYPDPTVVSLQGNAIAPVPLDGANLGNGLIWDGTQWLPMPMPFELDLIRIVGTSWEHGGNTMLAMELDGAPVTGLAVGFGREPGDLAPVDRSTIRPEVFRVFARHSAERFPDDPLAPLGLIEYVELDPLEVIPMDVEPGPLIQRMRPPATDDAVNGMFFRLRVEIEDLLELEISQLRIEIAGDHILDRDGRAIDAEFTRSSLPVGDRPERVRLGTQGGKFESWVGIG